MSDRKPIANVKSRGLEVTMWPAGDKGVNVTIRKRYKDKDGNWKDGTSFFAEELPLLAALLMKVFSSTVHLDLANKPQVSAPAQPSQPVPQSFETDDIPF